MSDHERSARRGQQQAVTLSVIRTALECLRGSVTDKDVAMAETLQVCAPSGAVVRARRETERRIRRRAVVRLERLMADRDVTLAEACLRLGSSPERLRDVLGSADVAGDIPELVRMLERASLRSGMGRRAWGATDR